MEENLAVIRVVTTRDKDGISAEEVFSAHKGKKFKIQEIMLGAGNNRKPVKYTKFFLQPGGEYLAEVLVNGKLRIIR